MGRLGNSQNNPLLKASVRALINELRTREGIRFIKEKDTYTIIVEKKEVDI